MSWNIQCPMLALCVPRKLANPGNLSLLGCGSFSSFLCKDELAEATTHQVPIGSKSPFLAVDIRT